MQGAKDKTALTRTVRRDIDPMTNPPVQAQPIKRRTLHQQQRKAWAHRQPSRLEDGWVDELLI